MAKKNISKKFILKFFLIFLTVNLLIVLISAAVSYERKTEASEHKACLPVAGYVCPTHIKKTSFNIGLPNTFLRYEENQDINEDTGDYGYNSSYDYSYSIDNDMYIGSSDIRFYPEKLAINLAISGVVTFLAMYSFYSLRTKNARNRN